MKGREVLLLSAEDAGEAQVRLSLGVLDEKSGHFLPAPTAGFNSWRLLLSLRLVDPCFCIQHVRKAVGSDLQRSLSGRC